MLEILVILLCLQLLSALPSPGQSTYSRTGYYYSDYSYVHIAPKVFLPGPQYCPETGRTVCKDAPYYPEELIFLILNKSKAYGFNLSSTFVDEREGDPQPNTAQLPDWPLTSYDPSYTLDRPTSVHHDYTVPNHRPWNKQYNRGYRKGRQVKKRNDEDSELACTARTVYMPPRAALSDKSQWKYVVNIPERNPQFKQIIRVETCRFPGSSCSSQISLPFGYVSKCTQKHIKKKLLSLDQDGRGTSEESFFVPSCCVCQLVRNFGN